tara:strand:- start:55 stop:474 length:420 start_codon:yes stop_codon:yes gene_type:complete
MKLGDRIKLEKANLQVNKNRKSNTGSTVRKNKPIKQVIKKEKLKSKKVLALTAKKLKTASDMKTPKQKEAGKKFQAAEIEAHKKYLKDVEKSLKAHRSGTQSGKAFAKQHNTRKTLIGRKFNKVKNKLRSGLSIGEKNR